VIAALLALGVTNALALAALAFVLVRRRPRDVADAPPPLTARVVAEAQILPPDLEAIAMAESEPWARDDVRAALRDRFLERRSWDRVRGDVFMPPSQL
jgi:hypothetical protein